MKKTSLFRAILAICVIGLALLAVPPMVGLILSIIADAEAVDFVIVMAIVLVCWGIRYEYEYFVQKRNNTVVVSGVVLVTLSVVVILSCLFQDAILNMDIAYSNLKHTYSMEFLMVEVIGAVMIILAVGMMTSLLILSVNKKSNRKEKERIEEEEADLTEELENYKTIVNEYYGKFLDVDGNVDDQSEKM